MKECITCHRILEDTEFSIVRTSKTTGKAFLRSSCKDCMKLKRSPNKTLDNTPKIKDEAKNMKPQFYKDQLEVCEDKLTSEEIQQLKDIIKRFNFDFKAIKKDNRIIKSFNIEVVLFDHLKEFSKERNITVSDSLNLILELYFVKKERG